MKFDKDFVQKIYRNWHSSNSFVFFLTQNEICGFDSNVSKKILNLFQTFYVNCYYCWDSVVSSVIECAGDVNIFCKWDLTESFFNWNG